MYDPQQSFFQRFVSKISASLAILYSYVDMWLGLACDKFWLLIDWIVWLRGILELTFMLVSWTLLAIVIYYIRR